jgi:dTDP-4-dehydrorhamnose reductase
MKILLLGSHGQVGWELARSLMGLGDIIALNRASADFDNLEGLRQLVDHLKPDVVVNAVAYTAVDKAESERELAFLINASAVEVLAQTCKKINALLIHYSTDYVFDGTHSQPYQESDQPKPLNVYGESKLAGELAIIDSGVDYLILRTTWVFAARGTNFLNSILRLATQREELNIVNDQIGAPTWARFIALATAHIIVKIHQERTLQTFQSGVYHLTSAGETSWYGFASEIIAWARTQEAYPLKNRSLNAIPTTSYPTPAKRPLNSRLSTLQLTTRFGLVMPSWKDMLTLCLADWQLLNINK